MTLREWRAFLRRITPNERRLVALMENESVYRNPIAREYRSSRHHKPVDELSLKALIAEGVVEHVGIDFRGFKHYALVKREALK